MDMARGQLIWGEKMAQWEGNVQFSHIPFPSWLIKMQCVHSIWKLRRLGWQEAVGLPKANIVREDAGWNVRPFFNTLRKVCNKTIIGFM